MKKVIWGVQPETVRKFRVEVFGPDNWRVLTRVRDNYQRKVILKFEPTAASLVRLVCEAPAEGQGVHIHEIRVYT